MNHINKAILILTNGNSSAVEVSQSTLFRLKKVTELDIQESIIITSTGYTVNKKPFLNTEGFPVFESVLAAHTLVDKLNVASDQIIAESFSRDTIGNIYLSLTSILMPMGIKNLVVVSSEFHLNRVKLICNWLSQLFIPNISIEFIAAENPAYEIELAEAVAQKENEAIVALSTIIQKITKPQDFVFWFFHEHKAYSHLVFPETINNILQKAY
jgi:hypothetical protein